MIPSDSRLRRAALALTACAGLVPSLAACGGSGSDAGAADSYKVGLVLQLSGTGSVYAEETQAGQKAALADVNAGNVAGRPFTPVTADAGSDAQSATTTCNRLVQQEKVQAIVAFITGPQLLACNSAAGRARIPLLSLSSGAGTICAPNLTSYGLVPNQQTLPIIDQLVGQGRRKWYFFGADYSTPKATIGLAKPYLRSKGGQVVGESYEPIGTSDFSQDITAIVKARPDVVFLNFIGNDDVTLQKQWAADPRTKGIDRVDILLGEGPAKALGQAADGIWSASAYFSSITGTGNDQFKAAVAKGGLAAEPDINAYVSYVQVQALARAVKTGGTDAQKVIAALKNVGFTAPVGPFQTRDSFTAQPVYLAQAGTDGTFVIRQEAPPIAPQASCGK